MATRASARCPGRVNLIGEHTDYNAGLCLPLTLPVATTVTLHHRPDDRIRVVSDRAGTPWEGTLADAAPGAVSGWAGYAVGVLWALGEAGWSVPGLEVEVTSTVPLGAGLSSSAALEGAVALALAGLLELPVDADLRRTLVAACLRAESEVVGAPTGGLDQTVCLLSEPDAALLVDFADPAHTQVRAVPLPLADAGLVLLVTDTKVSHALDGGSEYGVRRRECEAAVRRLGVGSLREVGLSDIERLDDELLGRRARHVVTENARVEQVEAALGASDWAGVGAAMVASHASLRDDYEVSCAEVDLAVATAVDAGALGARMTGGGFGGSIVALVTTEREAKVREALDRAFADADLAAPDHLAAVPSGPAHLLDLDDRLGPS